MFDANRLVFEGRDVFFVRRVVDFRLFFLVFRLAHDFDGRGGRFLEMDFFVSSDDFLAFLFPAFLRPLVNADRGDDGHRDRDEDQDRAKDDHDDLLEFRIVDAIKNEHRDADANQDGGKGDSFVYSGYTLYVEEDIDPSLIKGRLEEAKSKLEFEIARSEKMLSNPGFVAKAPKAKIDLEKSKLEENKAKLESVKKSLAELN